MRTVPSETRESLALFTGRDFVGRLLPMALENSPQDATNSCRARRAAADSEGDPMTGDWSLRRCASCGILESDPNAVLVFDWATGEIVHLASNGVQRCGSLVVVNDAEV